MRNQVKTALLTFVAEWDARPSYYRVIVPIVEFRRCWDTVLSDLSHIICLVILVQARLPPISFHHEGLGIAAIQLIGYPSWFFCCSSCFHRTASWEQWITIAMVGLELQERINLDCRSGWRVTFCKWCIQNIDNALTTQHTRKSLTTGHSEYLKLTYLL